MKQFLIRRWFLIGLAVVLLAGLLGAKSLRPLSEMKLLRDGLVACVLFVMALPLRAVDLWQTVRRPLAPLLAVAVNFGLLPLFAWGLAGAVLTPMMAAGVYVAAATPCTLASAAVWTRRAGGNDGIAILVTILTNSSCFVVTPLWLYVTAGQTETNVPPLSQMIGKLAVLVVLPMLLAQLCRVHKRVAEVATAGKTLLGIVAQTGILTMVLFGAIKSGLSLTGSGESLRALECLKMLIVILTIHISMWFAAGALGRLCRLSRPDWIAVSFAGSQKTLMVGLQVALDSGITILPMVSYHVGQLIVDTFLADRLKWSGSEQERGAAQRRAER